MKIMQRMHKKYNQQSRNFILGLEVMYFEDFALKDHYKSR